MGVIFIYEDKIIVGDRLKRLLKSQNTSTNTIAGILNISRQEAHRIINRDTIRLEILTLILATLQISLKDFVENENLA